MKYKTRTLTKTDKTTSDRSSGWYTKEDMQKILKWNATLFHNVFERNMFEINGYKKQDKQYTSNEL